MQGRQRDTAALSGPKMGTPRGARHYKVKIDFNGSDVHASEAKSRISGTPSGARAPSYSFDDDDFPSGDS